MSPSFPRDHLTRFGYAMLRSVFGASPTHVLADQLSAALQTNEPSVLRSRGHTYGSRDLITLLPEICDIPRRPVLREFITEVLGTEAGLVRALYFDKPPQRR